MRRISCQAVPVLLGFFFLSIYLLSGSSDLQHNGDTDLRYQTTAAMVDHHRLWIDHPLWLDTRVAVGRGGHKYAFYGPGQSLLMAPLYVAGKFLAHHLSLPYDVTTLYASRSLDLFLATALVVLFYILCRGLSYSVQTSVVLTLIFGLATSIWPDAQSALEQTQVDLFLLFGAYAVWMFVKGGLNRRAWLIAAGVGAGLALVTRYDAFLYMLLLPLYPLVVRWMAGARRKVAGDAAVYGLAVAPWVGIVALWNIARFGSPFLTGLHERTFGEPLWSGAANLLVSPGKGLVWFLPLVFLLPWAVPPFYRRFPSLTWFWASILLVTLLFYSNVLYWHGDPSWGPRYLYVVIPYLIAPLGELLAGWEKRSKRFQIAFCSIVVVSLAVQVAAVSVSEWRYWYRLQVAESHTSNPFRWGSPYYHYYWNVRYSPILIQFDNVYQVIRLNLGDDLYRLTVKPPDPYVGSNPAQDYPINSLAFWWADVRHPILGLTTRIALALALLFLALCAAWGLLIGVRTPFTEERDVLRELELSAADPPRS